MTGGAPAGPGGGGDAAAESLIDTVQALLRELPGLFSDRVELFTLELSRASAALGRIVAWLVSIAVVGVTAWLALWAGLGVGLVHLGLHWALALLLVLAVNLLAVVVGLNQVRRLARQLSLPATRRHLTLGNAWSAPEAAPPTGSAHHAGADAAPPVARW
ncbi:phage holin family protein [Ideonella sp.]|uniref:phage holin family protein n=1 Tax=Ideonella sp. TaxID=1929293 RepID=UPI002B4A5785|nr:phage holin family protein [Ideonella sp.]HJV71321.1 phage holin family protein [Ideonella sp.]